MRKHKKGIRPGLGHLDPGYLNLEHLGFGHLVSVLLAAAVLLVGCGGGAGRGSGRETEAVTELESTVAAGEEEGTAATESSTMAGGGKADTAAADETSTGETENREIQEVLPRRYDGREHGRTAAVRDQKDLGTCWAFASVSALESHLLPGESWDFSEDHMSHDPDFLLGQTGGGEYTMAMAYLLSGQGPVTEEQDPYGDGTSPEDAEPVKAVQEIRILPEKDLEAVKRAVLRWGGVQSSLYLGMKNESDMSEFYRAETRAYCCPTEQAPNHDIVIVGWDDDFPKESFSSELQRDGAFICENSWGTAFGEDGFFYVSYEDSNLGKNNVVYSDIRDPDWYDRLYQSDRCGWIGQLGYGGDTAWAANVYTAQADELLTAAGFYATDQNTEYEIYLIHDIPENPTDLDFAARRRCAKGSLQYAGFYTISFDEAEAVAAGERFAVMIRLKTPGVVHPIAIEYDAGDGKCLVDLEDGEGYISAEGTRRWEHVETSQSCNLCLKAYAVCAREEKP